jgi:hypothetical protein
MEWWEDDWTESTTPEVTAGGRVALGVARPDRP